MNKILTPIVLFIGCSLQLWAQLNWEFRDGPQGAFHSNIVANDSFMFAPEDDFLFRTSDGVLWEKIEQFVGRSLMVYDNSLYTMIRSDTVLKVSNDNGRTWVTNKVIDAVRNPFGMVACSHGIYHPSGHRSHDQGLTWEYIYTPKGSLNRLFIVEDKVYVSNNVGEIWRFLENTGVLEKLFTSTPEQYIYKIDGMDSVLLFSQSDKIIRSSDLGKTWKNTGVSPSVNGSVQFVVNGDDIYYYNKSMFQSSDLGITWDSIPWEQDGIFDIHKISSFKNELYLSTRAHGVWKWDDGVNLFFERNLGLNKALISDMTHSNNYLWMVAENGIYNYHTATNYWSRFLPNLLMRQHTIDCNEKGAVLYSDLRFFTGSVGNYRAYYLISENNGITWDTIHIQHPNFAPPLGGAVFLDDHIVASGSPATLISYDRGVSWSELGFYISSLETIKFQNKHYLWHKENLYITDDDGQTWSTEIFDLDIKKVIATEDHLFVVLSEFDQRYLYLSIDDNEWKDITNGLVYDGFNSIDVYDIFQRGNEFVIVWGLVNFYQSTDLFTSWRPLQSNKLGNHYAQVGSSSFLAERGLYEFNLDDILSSTTSLTSTFETRSLQITPNPSKGSFIVQSVDEKKSEGLLSIYSKDGRLCDQRKIETLDVPIKYSNQSLAIGTYLVIVETDGVRFIGKVAIVK